MKRFEQVTTLGVGLAVLGAAGILGGSMLLGGPDTAEANSADLSAAVPGPLALTVHPMYRSAPIAGQADAQPDTTDNTPADNAASTPAPVVVVEDGGFDDFEEMDGFEDEPTPAASNTRIVILDEDDGFDDFDSFVGDNDFEDADGFGDDGFDDEPAPSKPRITTAMLDAMDTLPGDLAALPLKPAEPADNPTTDEKIELGRLLYFDTRLSGDHSMSCATCHHPDKGYADDLALATGFGGMTLGRHSPTVLNAAYNTKQFWDGRADTLEQQAAGPIMAKVEMNMPSVEEMVKRLNADADYPAMFDQVFGEGPTLENVAKAIATFERTIVTPNSRFDAYARGDKTALSEDEKQGLVLFFGKASCTNCHSGPNFTDDLYHNLGLIPERSGDADGGRFAVTGKDEDFGAFRTPTVRNAELTAPFMHDGSVATLEELVEFYDRGGHDGVNRSELLQPLKLTEEEKAQLVAFMKSLTGTLPDVTDPWAKDVPSPGLVEVETDTE